MLSSTANVARSGDRPRRNLVIDDVGAHPLNLLLPSWPASAIITASQVSKAQGKKSPPKLAREKRDWNNADRVQGDAKPPLPPRWYYPTAAAPLNKGGGCFLSRAVI